jgi:hypothetical protein
LLSGNVNYCVHGLCFLKWSAKIGLLIKNPKDSSKIDSLGILEEDEMSLLIELKKIQKFLFFFASLFSFATTSDKSIYQLLITINDGKTAFF